MGGWIFLKETRMNSENQNTAKVSKSYTCGYEFSSNIMTYNKYRNKTEAEADYQRLYQISS